MVDRRPWGRAFPLVFLLLFLLAPNVSAKSSFRVALVLPSGQNPWTDLAVPEGHSFRWAVADGLVTADPRTGMPVAGLALAWKASVDRLHWEFTLRKATWSDGSRITASDFVSSWARAGLKGIVAETTNPQILRVTFSKPIADVAVFLTTQYLLAPTEKKTSGPFVVSSQDSNRWLLKANPRFRDAKRVLIDQLEFRWTDSLETALTLFRTGQVDWVPLGGGPGTWSRPGLSKAVVSPGWGLVFLRLNLASPRLGDDEYRQELARNLDRKSLLDGLRGPLLVAESSWIPGQETTVPKPPKRRPEGPRPQPLLSLVYPQGEVYRTLAEGIADQWQRTMGVHVDLVPKTPVEVLEARHRGLYDVALSAWVGDYPGESAFLGFLTSGHSANDLGFRDPAFDADVETLSTANSGAARTNLRSEILVTLGQEVPTIPLATFGWTNVIDLRRWTGWTANPVDLHSWVGISPRR